MRALAILLILIAGCASPTAPQAPEPTPVDLRGRWEGTITYPDPYTWTLLVVLEDDLIWKERCSYACARLNVEREGSFDIQGQAVTVRFTQPERGRATLQYSAGCLRGTINLARSGQVTVCR